MVVRAYGDTADYDLVYDFLCQLYEPADHLPCWLPPRWEYMHGHPPIDSIDPGSIGVAEKGGRIVGVVHPEHVPGVGYLQLRPSHRAVSSELLEWAQQCMARHDAEADRARLGLFVDDADTALQELMTERGFEVAPAERESHARIRLDAPLTEAPLPADYHLTSLADDDDPAKVDRVLWRGFGRPGEPPHDGVDDRTRMQRTPHYRHDLNLVAVAPDGSYAAHAGLWHVPALRVAYVEPVATDTDHRRRGLGRALVTETLRRVQAEGASVAWVGSDLRFYLSMSFKVVAGSTLWRQELASEPEA